MAYSYSESTGDGVTVAFTFAFTGRGYGYIAEENLHVYIMAGEVWGEVFNFSLSGPNQLQFTAAPPAPTNNKPNIMVRRIVPKDVPYSDFSRGNNFGQSQMNNTVLQQLYALHEFFDGFWPASFSVQGNMDMRGFEVINVGDPTTPASAVNRAYLDAIVPSLILASSSFETATSELHDLFQTGATQPVPVQASGGIWNDTTTGQLRFSNGVTYSTQSTNAITLNGLTSAEFATAAQGALAAAALPAASYTAADVLAKVKTLDGAGSGLDADQWHGYSPSDLGRFAPVRQSVLHGSVDANGLANFLTVGTGLSVNIAATTVPVVICGAYGSDTLGAVNRIGRVVANTSVGSLTANATQYLYADINPTTLAVTFGAVALAPTYGYGSTKSITLNQHTYRIDEGCMYIGSGAAAVLTCRVFIGECVTGASTVTSVISYALQGSYAGVWTNTAPTTSTVTSKNHNIGTIPQSCTLYLRCLTAEIGYAIGDVITGFVTCDSGTYDRNITYCVSALSCQFSTLSAYNLIVCNKAGATSLQVTPANWAYSFTVKRGW